MNLEARSLLASSIAALLRQNFQDLLGPAKALKTGYLPQIEATARELNAAKVMAPIKGR